MAYDYTPLNSTATRLISDKGRSVTLKNTTYSTYDPVTDTTTGDVETQTTASIVQTSRRFSEIDASSVKQGDLFALIESSAAIDLKTLIVDGSDTWHVVWFQDIKPGDTVMLYKVQMRK